MGFECCGSGGLKIAALAFASPHRASLYDFPILYLQTSEQESLRQEAIQQATDLIGDTAVRHGATFAVLSASFCKPVLNASKLLLQRSATTDPFNFFDFVASRIEFSLNKQAASQRWADTEAPPVSTATASPFSRSFIVKSRSLKSVDCSHSDAQESELSTDGRGLLASSTCKTYTNINYIGAQLNFKQSITKSSDCCAYCKSTKGCVAWSLNLSSKMPKSKRGCYLKTKGYTTKKNVKGVISGTVTASRE